MENKRRRFQTSISKIVELTRERQQHIFDYHPDIIPFFNKIPEVLKHPDQIRRSTYDKEVILFYKYYSDILGGKYLSVVVKINKRNFILTAYLTQIIKIGEKYER